MRVRLGVLPGRIEIDESEVRIATGDIANGRVARGQVSQSDRHVPLFKLKVFADFEGSEIRLQGGDGGGGAFDEGDVRCTAAERLDANGSCAGVEIGEARAFDVRR